MNRNPFDIPEDKFNYVTPENRKDQDEMLSRMIRTTRQAIRYVNAAGQDLVTKAKIQVEIEGIEDLTNLPPEVYAAIPHLRKIEETHPHLEPVNVYEVVSQAQEDLRELSSLEREERYEILFDASLKIRQLAKHIFILRHKN